MAKETKVAIKSIGPESAAEAAAVLATAFADDPVFRWMAHDRRGLDSHLRHGFGAMIGGDLPDGAPPMTAMWRDPR